MTETAEAAAPRPTVEALPVLKSSAEDGIAVLTLNDPQRRNPLSRAMMGALSAAIDEVNRDRSVRAIVLAANGPVFSAGHDLKELNSRRADVDSGLQFFESTMSECAALMQRIVYSSAPVIAAVHATATAAGCQLVASCDLAVAAASAKFATPGVNIGLFCSTPMVALSRNVSRKHAMEMLLLGDTISAEDAARYGLVNRVVEDGQALDGALALARRIRSKPRATVTLGKRAFYEQAEMPLSDAYQHAVGVMVRNMMGADAIEGIGAFLEKRHPHWDQS